MKCESAVWKGRPFCAVDWYKCEVRAGGPAAIAFELQRLERGRSEDGWGVCAVGKRDGVFRRRVPCLPCDELRVICDVKIESKGYGLGGSKEQAGVVQGPISSVCGKPLGREKSIETYA